MQLLDLHLGRPLHRGPLTLFPVWNGRAVSTSRGYLQSSGRKTRGLMSTPPTNARNAMSR